ncbi:MAG: OmpA family protein [Candidatus Zixiibacteriota bacterium]|nr:MAG: OmpA family protein [candidate division Zixibacteria bacterium]
MIFRRPKNDDDKENLERWLLTYADLITLLLAFFIVLYSMSRLDAEKFESISRALRTILRGAAASPLPYQTMMMDDPGAGPIKAGDLNFLKSKIDKLLLKKGLDDRISASIEDRGLVIRISESAFFDLGSAELKEQAKGILDLFGSVLGDIPNHVRIEGHTDNLPIRNMIYPSNWELSTYRATTCIRYLIENYGMEPDRVSAMGYSEYRPIADNSSVEGRNKNRRVDIVVLNWDEKHKEPSPKNEDISQSAEKNSVYNFKNTVEFSGVSP